MAWGPYDFIVSILFTDKTGLSTNFKLLIFGRDRVTLRRIPVLLLLCITVVNFCLVWYSLQSSLISFPNTIE